MLAKCTSPWCLASFRRLDEGKLFRLEAEQTLRSSKAKAAEYFWLCKDCSAAKTLHLAQDGRVMATALPESLHNALHDAPISVNRENGLLLRSVSFLRRSHPRGT
jgi:hypothetical protein